MRNQPKRLTPDIETKLNERVNGEYKSAQIYESIANWCNCYGFFKAKDLFRKYADEERVHMRKMIDYIIDRNGEAKLGVCPAFDIEYKSLLDVVETAYKHEVSITEAYRTLSTEVLASKDQVTYGILQWFLQEQIEEEAKFADALVIACNLGITHDTKGMELMEFEESLSK